VDLPSVALSTVVYVFFALTYGKSLERESRFAGRPLNRSDGTIQTNVAGEFSPRNHPEARENALLKRSAVTIVILKQKSTIPAE
jgi:hypothetical protein